MSQILATKEYLLATQLGIIQVQSDLVVDFDVEDLVRSNAISQARSLQLQNIGAEIDQNASLPTGTIPSAFVGTTSE